MINSEKVNQTKSFISGKEYYQPEIPKQTKSRFRNITLYKNCKYENNTKQTNKILEEYYEQNEHRTMLDIAKDEKEKWLPELFDLLQATYTMIQNNFSSVEISSANKKHLEKMINKYESKNNSTD